MKKSIFLAALLTISSSLLTVTAQNPYSMFYTDLPVQIKQVQPVVFPETRITLSDYGAKGDGKTLCTDAITAAIEDLVKKGGGHLDIPSGTWLTGPIAMKSNIDIHLADGATILFSPDKSLYVIKDKNGNKARKCVAMITAPGCQNIGITGKGTIDGQGQYWRPLKKGKVPADVWQQFLDMGGEVISNVWYPFNLKPELGIPNIAADAKKQENMRHYMINIIDAKNIVIEGVRLQNSPKFHLVPNHCENVIIKDVTIWCPGYAQNGDAMDIGNTKTVLVEGCEINCGDDGICMKGGAGQQGFDKGPDTDFLIQNNIVHQAHGGFVIGSDFSGGMKKLIVRNNTFDGTDIGLRFKSAPGRGGTCENIYCYNITMRNIIKDAILFETTYADIAVAGSATAKDDKTAWYPDFCGFYISNIKCESALNAITINGLPDNPVHDIIIKDCELTASKASMTITNARNITIKDTKITAKDSPKVDTASCHNICYDGNLLAK